MKKFILVFIFFNFYVYGLLMGQLPAYNELLIVSKLMKEGKHQLHNRHFDSAATHYNLAYGHLERSGYRKTKIAAKCLLHTANAFLSDGKIDSSIRYISLFDQSFKAGISNDPDIALLSDYLKGHMYYSLAQSDTANYFLRKSLSECCAPTHDSLYVLIIKDLGNLKFLQNEFDSALFFYNKALLIEQNRINRSELMISSLYQNIGIIHSKNYEYDKADNLFKISIEMKEKLLMHDDILLIKAYLNYSVFLMEVGDIYEALKYSRIAENTLIGKYSNSHYIMGHIYHNRSIILEVVGKEKRALLFSQKALNNLTHSYSNDFSAIGQNHFNLGLSYFFQKDYAVALDHLRTALNFKLAPVLQYGIRNTIASCYFELGENLLADLNFNKLLISLNCDSSINRLIESEIYCNYGNYCSSLGKDSLALLYFNKSIKTNIGMRNSNINQQINNMNCLANYHLKDKNYLKAIDNYNNAIQLYKNQYNVSDLSNSITSIPINVHHQIIYSLIGLSSTYYQRFFETSNLEDIYSCTDYLNLIWSLLDKVNRLTYSEESLFQRNNPEGEIIEIAINSYYILFQKTKNIDFLNALINIFERKKASNLAEGIKYLEALNFSGIPQEVITLDKNLKAQLTFCNQKLRSVNFIPSKQDCFNNHYLDIKFNVTNKHDSLIKHLENTYPKYYELKAINKNIKAYNLQAILDKESALISYSLSDTNLFTIILTNDSIIINKVSINNNFSHSITNYYSGIKKGESFIYLNNLSNSIYEKIINPILPIITDKTKLIIIPDSYLYYIPFETLCKPVDSLLANNNFSKQHYLIQDYAISYHYSSTLWYRGLLNSQSRDSTKSDNSFLGVAPRFASTNSVTTVDSLGINRNKSIITYRYSIGDGMTFSELPYSQKEVTDISNLFSSYGYCSQTLIDKHATEYNFKSSINNYKYIHIATHGFSDDENPELSGLAFFQDSIQRSGLNNNGTTPVKNTENSVLPKFEDDGILYSGEMYNLDIDADLMVLSACETGIGKLIKGEGMIAMTRGLIYSGVNNILYTHWKISDKHTHTFMLDFYSEVLNGLTYSEALRQAKLKMIANESTAFPKLWGGYMLIGQ